MVQAGAIQEEAHMVSVLDFREETYFMQKLGILDLQLTLWQKLLQYGGHCNLEKSTA